MALNNIGMGIIFTAQDLASRAITNLVRNFGGLDKSVGKSNDAVGKFNKGAAGLNPVLLKVGAGLTVAAIGFVGLASAVSLANRAGEFEQGLAAIGAVTKATTEELAALRDTAIQAGIATQFSPTQAVEGLTSLATAGQTANEAMQTLIPVLDLAAGSLGQLGVAGAAEAVVGTLNSYQIATDQAAGVTDKLLRITQLSNFQTRDFASGLAKAAASGSVFNQSLDDVLISMGLMRNANIDASSSATAFREATRRLGADQRAQAAVTELGVDVFDQQTGKMRSLLDIMGDFNKATKSLTDQQRLAKVQTAFGARGLLAFNAISQATFKTMRDGKRVTLEGAEAIAAMRMEMDNAEGTAASFRDALLDTFEGQKTLLAGTLETIAIAVGEPFAKVFKPLVGVVVSGLNAMLQLFNAIPASVKNGFAAFFTVGSAALLVAGLGAALLALIPIIKATAVGAAIFALPFIKIIAVVALVVGALFVLRRAWTSNFAGIQDAVLPILEKISLAFRSLFELFTTGQISGALATDLLRAENKGVFRFVNAVSKGAAVIGAIFKVVGRVIGRVLEVFSRRFAPVFGRMIVVASKLGLLFLKVLGLVAGVFGFDQALDSAVAIESLGQAIEVFLIVPLEKAITATALFADVLLFLADRAITNISGGISGFVALATGIETVFNVVSRTVTNAANLVTRVITGMVNGAISQINNLISKAARAVAFLQAPTNAAQQQVIASSLTSAFSVQPISSGQPVGGGPSTTSSGAPATRTRVPASRPLQQQQTGLSPEEILEIINAAQRVASGGRAVTVQGTVVMDTTVVGEVTAQNDRDERARVGSLAAPIGGN